MDSFTKTDLFTKVTRATTLFGLASLAFFSVKTGLQSAEVNSNYSQDLNNDGRKEQIVFHQES